MRRTLRGFAPPVLVAAFALAAPAAAGEKIHTVGSGESASSIAGRYYGDVKLGDFLLRFNEKAGTVIRSGEKLRIPYCEVHRVARGDTWGSLATKYLEKTSAHAAVAALNGFAPGDALPAGAQIVIPVVLNRRLERGESLASLATEHYGDPDRADVLQSFNDVDDPRRLSVGEAVGIPLTSIRLRKSPASELPHKQTAAVQPAKSAPEPAARTSSPRFAIETRSAATVYAEGDYARARLMLEALREKSRTDGTDEERAAILRLLVSVYVAFDMRAEACGAFAALPAPEAAAELDPDLISPRIRDVLSRCAARRS